MQISSRSFSPITSTHNPQIERTFYREDYELKASIMQRDKQAIEKFYEKYGGAFYGLISKTLMSDQVSHSIMEAAFTRIVTSIDQYDPTRERLFVWAYRIVRKEASKEKVNIVLRQIFCCN